MLLRTSVVRIICYRVLSIKYLFCFLNFRFWPEKIFCPKNFLEKKFFLSQIFFFEFFLLLLKKIRRNFSIAETKNNTTEFEEWHCTYYQRWKSLKLSPPHMVNTRECRPSSVDFRFFVSQWFSGQFLKIFIFTKIPTKILRPFSDSSFFFVLLEYKLNGTKVTGLWHKGR